MGIVKKAGYMDRLNKMEASTIFKARSTMLEIKKTIRTNILKENIETISIMEKLKGLGTSFQMGELHSNLGMYIP